MKIMLRTAAFAALILTVSCGKDTANTIADIFDEETEEVESTVLDIKTVSDNVLINGGTKMEGTPPTSNGSISLDVSNTGKTAFLNEGFDVSLNSDAEIKGVYIQFKSKDGIASDSYYDVNIETNNSGKAGKSMRRRVAREKIARIVNKNDDAILDIDFNTSIEPGEFCYEICVYDANGNISDPQDVCLTVESWGGNSEVVGKWELVKTYSDSSPNDFKTTNEDYCESEIVTRDCALGSITVEYGYESCDRIEYFEITMNSDGTYTERFKEVEKNIITDVVIPSDLTMEDLSSLCMYDFTDNEAVLTYEGDGNWAYLSDEDSFIFIEYNYEEIYDGDTYTDSFEPGDGSLYYGAGGDNGVVKLNNERLIISSFEFKTDEFEK